MSEIKQQQRRQAYDARNVQQNKDKLSHLICQRFIKQSEFQSSEWVMFYLHCRSEVRTQECVQTALSSGIKIVIPYCTLGAQGEKKLGLWWLQDMQELTRGMWGILEPPKHRWQEPGKEINPRQLDLIMVPGVGFDRMGGRLGNGAGYYDRLLQSVRSDCFLSGVCYESQLFDRIEMEEHDVVMDNVITERKVYNRPGR